MDERKGSFVPRVGGGDLGLGEREVERRGGGDRARVLSGAVSWYGAKSMVAEYSYEELKGWRSRGCDQMPQAVVEIGRQDGHAACGIEGAALESRVE